MDRTHAKTRKHAVAVGIFAHCFMLHFRSRRGVSKNQRDDLACTDPDFLLKTLGKMGLVIHSFANGWDESPVATEVYSAPIKSIGNSTTTPRDLENDLDVQIIFMALAESVSARLRKHGFKCNTVAISIRDNSLYHFSRQMHLREYRLYGRVYASVYQKYGEVQHGDDCR